MFCLFSGGGENVSENRTETHDRLTVQKASKCIRQWLDGENVDSSDELHDELDDSDSSVEDVVVMPETTAADD